MKITFIGLGNMGCPMATNLTRAGYDITVCDLDHTRAEPILALGAKFANTPSAAAKGADIVMTSLPGPQQISEIADSGMLENLREGGIWIELSTNNLEVERDVRAKAEARGISLLDAPVSGGTEGAANGTLTIMVGGGLAEFKRCQPILQTIGGEVIHLGDHGAGYVAKIAQVVLCYLHSVALAEALMLGVKGGVDADTMLAIIQNSTGRSYVADRYGPALLDGSYDPGFALGLAHKDMRLTLELAKSVDAILPMCEQVEALYGKASEAFGPEQNHLMAIRLLEQANGQFLRNENHRESA
jgi:3-hydroxyisobutyrate dehydrogenase-like beta-hydroxyacid dehydrogenase